MKISLSIADIPIGTSVEELFKIGKQTGIDGVEIFLGLKSKLSFNKLVNLSEKYNLPILTLHQPFWSFAGLYPDQSMFKIASSLNIPLVVHPPMKCLITSDKASKYFNWLVQNKNKYKINLAIENMPINERIDSFPFGYADEFRDIHKFYNNVCKRLMFELVLDTSHLRIIDTKMFKDLSPVLQNVKNIHLSDFNSQTDHLPLGTGQFPYLNFFSFLKKNKYNNIITLELSGNILYKEKKYYADCKDSLEKITNYFRRPINTK